MFRAQRVPRLWLEPPRVRHAYVLRHNFALRCVHSWILRSGGERIGLRLVPVGLCNFIRGSVCLCVRCVPPDGLEARLGASLAVLATPQQWRARLLANRAPRDTLARSRVCRIVRHVPHLESMQLPWNNNVAHSAPDAQFSLRYMLCGAVWDPCYRFLVRDMRHGDVHQPCRFFGVCGDLDDSDFHLWTRVWQRGRGGQLRWVEVDGSDALASCTCVACARRSHDDTCTLCGEGLICLLAGDVELQLATLHLHRV